MWNNNPIVVHSTIDMIQYTSQVEHNVLTDTVFTLSGIKTKEHEDNIIVWKKHRTNCCMPVALLHFP